MLLSAAPISGRIARGVARNLFVFVARPGWSVANTPFRIRGLDYPSIGPDTHG